MPTIQLPTRNMKAKQLDAVFVPGLGRTMKRLALASILFAAACATPAPRAATSADASQRANEAFAVVKTRLQATLTSAIQDGGPAKAIDVCRLEASALSRGSGFELGRTSFRLRNPDNAPREWAAAAVRAADGKRAGEVQAVTVDLGDRVGVLQPIETGGLCVTCHGPTEGLAPDVRAALALQYPADRATGYLPGSVRGFFWAEIPKPR